MHILHLDGGVTAIKIRPDLVIGTHTPQKKHLGGFSGLPLALESQLLHLGEFYELNEFSKLLVT